MMTVGHGERREEGDFSPDKSIVFRKGWLMPNDGMDLCSGIQAGRGDAAYLARFLEKDLLDMKALRILGTVKVKSGYVEMRLPLLRY